MIISSTLYSSSPITILYPTYAVCLPFQGSSIYILNLRCIFISFRRSSLYIILLIFLLILNSLILIQSSFLFYYLILIFFKFSSTISPSLKVSSNNCFLLYYLANYFYSFQIFSQIILILIQKSFILSKVLSFRLGYPSRYISTLYNALYNNNKSIIVAMLARYLAAIYGF